jgi:predicted dehydrogenase
MKMLKAGLIGCGNIGALYDEGGNGKDVYTHAGTYRAVEGIELVCASDADSGRLRDFGSHWGVERLYGDYRAMLQAEDLDMISIATPDHTHAGIIADAANLSRARLIFSEKPLAETLAEAVRLAALCREKNIMLVVDYVRRWDRNHQALRDFIRQDGLGAIQNMTGYYVRGLKHNGCQLINLIQFLFGNISDVQALGGVDQGSIPGDPTIDFRFILPDGRDGYMLGLDRKGYSFSIYELEIFGTKGRLRLLNGGQSIRFFPVENDPNFANFRKIGEVSQTPWGESATYGSALLHAGREFAGFLNGAGVALQNTAGVAIHDLAVIEAVLSSAQHSGLSVNVRKDMI